MACASAVAHAASPPALEFTSIPPVGSLAPLQGRALNVPFANYRVAVCINVFGWWNKPSWGAPLTSIANDGTWSCNVVTGGSDACATDFAAYLVPAAYTPPLVNGQSQLPAELDQNSVAKLVVSRAPPAATLSFAGYSWRVKSTGECQWGPGPNYYSASTNNVWLDSQNRLHLRLTHRNDAWQCAEVGLVSSLGYGTYKFLLETPADNFDPNVVLGFFTWSDDEAFHHRELDIEFSKWSYPPNANNAQFVVQPFAQPQPQHLLAFREPAGVDTSTQVFTWEPTRVLFQSLRGFDPYTSQIARVIRQWTFTTSSEIPPPGDESAHMNLWLFNGVPPSDGQEVEVIIHGFQFTPAPPTLSITQAGAAVLVTWPSGYLGFNLETSPTAFGPWSPSQMTPIAVNGSFQLPLPATAAATFLRLSRSP